MQSPSQALEPMQIDEFIRRLKLNLDSNPDARYCFFLGAGASVSSGILTAGQLVRDHWLKKLKHIKTGNTDNLNSWAENNYKGILDEPASFYGKIISELFISPKERQQEIKSITQGIDPSFGYAVLAQLMTHSKYASRLNVVLTTNFDDLVADALYLYKREKPLVIVHESLSSFMRPSNTRPLVVKLHGDAQLEPKNTAKETEHLKDNVKNALAPILRDSGIIFIGYSGNDNSIVTLLQELPEDSLASGIYWVNSSPPSNNMMYNWLIKRQGIWVKHRDFDTFFLECKSVFQLSKPNLAHSETLENSYDDKLEPLRITIKQDDKLQSSLENALIELEWWKIYEEASQHHISNPQKADKIYQDGIQKLPNKFQLIGSYAFFLHHYIKDFPKAKKFYLHTLKLAPNDIRTNSNYALLLDQTKIYDEANKYYKKTLRLSPNYVKAITNYAYFLTYSQEDFDLAETLYQKALDLEANFATISNYAYFLSSFRGNYEGADKLYRHALELAPNNIDITCNYIKLLFIMEQNNQALEYIKKINNQEFDLDLKLELNFYAYAHLQDQKYLDSIQTLLHQEVRSPDWYLNDNITIAIKHQHPEPELLKVLARVINAEENIKKLDEFPIWKRLSKT